MTKTLCVYPSVGLVEVVKILPASREEAQATVYRLETKHGFLPSTITVASDKAVKNGMRALSSRAEYREACQILRQCKKVYGGISAAKKVYSIEAWRARIVSGDFLACARIVRDFYRAPSEKPMKSVEKAIFEEALLRLSAESAALLGWQIPARIGEMKRKMLRLLTLPRWDLTQEEEARKLSDQVDRSIAVYDPKSSEVFNKGRSLEAKPHMIPCRFGGHQRCPS